ncbi:hypothetical protein Kpho02_59710 [Kitasatospora phosalacinea]|uniref:Uncharacterized protein n=1 Tax=Kitasatospora phosalacinea TaxID=2065 RepID=A0A9W6QBC8_9ACTN|nr:hypothetical protein [Kitasatospora phosalacinea]GLW73672.1 hypothetical protein Kpho02_59710 [Kitasatospora phosalacinea]
MTAQHTPDQPEHDFPDDDLVFPTTAHQMPQFNSGGDEDKGGHPDVIWHQPRRARHRLRDKVPASFQHLPDAGLVLAALATLVLVLFVLVGVTQAVLAVIRWCADPQHLAHPAAQLWHTVNDPLHRSLTARGAELPAGPGTLYEAWAAAGIVILLLALRRGASVGVQLGSVLFGALTVAMVWDGSTGPGRPVAAGLAVLIWAVLAALALTGSWITTHTTVVNTVQPAPAPDITVDVAPAEVPAPVVEVTVPEPRIETVLVVDTDGDARRTSRPDQ